MDNEVKTWLYDVLQAIIEIEGYFENIPVKYNDYISDIKEQNIYNDRTNLKFYTERSRSAEIRNMIIQ